MRKTLTVVALTAALTGGTATVALADDAVAAPPATQSLAQAQEQDSDRTGLWGLLGLLGLAGLVKRKESADDSSARR